MRSIQGYVSHPGTQTTRQASIGPKVRLDNPGNVDSGQFFAKNHALANGGNSSGLPTLLFVSDQKALYSYQQSSLGWYVAPR